MLAYSYPLNSFIVEIDALFCLHIPHFFYTRIELPFLGTEKQKLREN